MTSPSFPLQIMLFPMLLAGCGGADPKTYPSLPGPKPEGCARSLAYDQGDMTADLAYLASPELDGRAPGSAGDSAARAFVAERFACLGLMGVGDITDFQQPFATQSCENTANVLAMIPGTESQESIVISAHIDHFGRGRLGANDNASGVTALLAIAQDMVNQEIQPKRTIIFAVFGSEESGFEGSEYFMSHPPAGVDISQIVYNINMDMVGSYSEAGILDALGTFDNTAGTDAVTTHMNEHPSIDVSIGYESDLSDNVSFCERGIPYVFFWTEDKKCYHKKCDTSTRIDYEALSEIAALIAATSLELADSSADLGGDVQPNQDVCLEP